MSPATAPRIKFCSKQLEVSPNYALRMGLNACTIPPILCISARWFGHRATAVHARSANLFRSFVVNNCLIDNHTFASIAIEAGLVEVSYGFARRYRYRGFDPPNADACLLFVFAYKQFLIPHLRE